MIQCLTSFDFNDYELLDTGNSEKLERFGKFIIARPEPQALWDKSLSNFEWEKLAHAWFKRDTGNDKDNSENTERGKWIVRKNMPDRWFVNYVYKSMNLKMRLAMTAFKHIGIFPEQTENWNYIYDSIQTFKSGEINVLNLFAYTGGASLAARAAGADVTHVDSVRQVITWSHENMDASKLDNIHWVAEDAMKFVQREVRRKNNYNGIILDPPAYGRGPAGEKWILEKSINDLLKYCSQLLKEKDFFLVMNLYSMGFSSLVAESLIKSIFHIDEPEFGELFLTDRAGRKLPLGVFIRFRK
jgi:23S rRNA (cytosine1962-C5)-methyltransferase